MAGHSNTRQGTNEHTVNATTNDENKRAIPELHIDAQVIANRLAKVEEGETITYEEISALISVPDIRSQNHRHRMESARRVAQREHGKVFECVHGIGLKCLTSKDKAGLHRGATRRMHTLARRTAKKIATADYDSLDREARAEYNAGLSMMGALSQATKPKVTLAIRDAVDKQSEKLAIASTLKLFGGNGG